MKLIWVGVVLGLVAACGGDPQTPPVATDLTSIRTAQKHSLSYVFYAGNPMPPAPTEQELSAIDGLLAAAPEADRETLQRLYGNDRELLVYATRDSDQDGIFDYGVSDMSGKFYESDPDIDADGIRNVLDPEPYLAQPGREDGRLPAHLDWALQSKPERSVFIQKELFEKNGIALVERTAEFPPMLVESVYDNVTKLYRTYFEKQPLLPTLRTIATEYWVELDEVGDDGSFAVVYPRSQSMLIHKLGLESPPLIQLGLIAHEMGHSFQFNMDFDSESEMARRFQFDSLGFMTLAQDFGWKAAFVSPRNVQPSIFLPQYLDAEAYDFSFQLHPIDRSQLPTWESTQVWESLLATLPMDAPLLTHNHIIGSYSMSNPYEYVSDHATAYLYQELENEAVEGFGEDRQAVQDHINTQTKEVWGDFTYSSSFGSAVYTHNLTQWPMKKRALREMVRKYLPARNQVVQSTL